MKSIPVIVVSSPKENESFILPSQLPGNDVKYALWHQLPKNEVTGDELKCPRIRKGPDVDSSSSSSSSSDSSDIESGKRVKLKHDYKSEKENWKQAKIVNFSYQDLGHAYQVKNFMRVLKQLQSCIQLQLVDNALQDVSKVVLPQCRSLNAQKNYFTSFQDLPTCATLHHLNLSENNMSSLKGSDRFKSLISLDLTLNPIQFTENYRSRVFGKFPNLKYLDGIAQTRDDRPEDRKKETCTVV